MHWGFEVEDGETRLQGWSGSLTSRMLFSFPIWWNEGVAANQRVGKVEEQAWFDVSLGSDHHSSRVMLTPLPPTSKHDAILI